MKNTATLGQINKLLSFLEGIPSEQVQKVIESGFFSDVIRTGQLDALAQQKEATRLEALWKVIGLLTNFQGISITVPHEPYQHANADQVYKFQLRCWQGEHGYTDRTRGHVDSGSAKGKLLFETAISAKLRECSCCWPEDLKNLGVNVRGDDANEWVMETKETGKGSHFDIITYCPRKKSNDTKPNTP